MERPKIICLTPVKNEAWILERFLKCASLWADHIIIADQQSDDGSREIASSFPKVTVVENASLTFNEPERQKLLIQTARQFTGPRLLIALDADEFLTGNYNESPEWDTLLRSPVGTILRFQWPVIQPDMLRYFSYPQELVFGYMDDGANHIGRPFHSPRLPIPHGAPEISLREIKVMHFAYTDTDRVKSKLRWYQCWETLHRPPVPPMTMFRSNYKDLFVAKEQTDRIPAEWFDGYRNKGIDMTSVYKPAPYRWDRQVVEMMMIHGAATFRKLAIWDKDWETLRKQLDLSEKSSEIRDPRNLAEKTIHRWLDSVQTYYSNCPSPRSRSQRYVHEAVDCVLRSIGW